MTRVKHEVPVVTESGVPMQLWSVLIPVLETIKCARVRDGVWVINTAKLKDVLAKGLVHRNVGDARRQMLADIVAREQSAVMPPEGVLPTLRAAVATSRAELAEQVVALGREGYEAETDVALYQHDNGMVVLNYFVQVMRPAVLPKRNKQG